MLDPTLTAYGPWGIVLAIAIAFLTQWLRNRSTPTAPSSPASPAGPTPANPTPAPVPTPIVSPNIIDRLAELLARLEQRFGEPPKA